MEKLITELHKHNVEMTPKYHEILLQPDAVTPRKNDVVVSKEIPMLGLEYFDLVAINIILSEHKGLIYTPGFDIVDIASSMFHIGNRRWNMLTEHQAIRFCESIAKGGTPSNMLVYQLLNQIKLVERFKGDVWLAYMMPLLGLVKVEPSETHPYRSRMLVSYMYRYMLTDNSKAHDHDIVVDRLGFLSMLKAYITTCTSDSRYQNDAYIVYMLDSLRMLVVVYLAALLRRSCTWNEFKPMASAVFTQKLQFHEGIVRMHKELHNLTGVVNQ